MCKWERWGLEAVLIGSKNVVSQNSRKPLNSFIYHHCFLSTVYFHCTRCLHYIWYPCGILINHFSFIAFQTNILGMWTTCRGCQDMPWTANSCLIRIVHCAVFMGGRKKPPNIQEFQEGTLLFFFFFSFLIKKSRCQDGKWLDHLNLTPNFHLSKYSF